MFRKMLQFARKLQSRSLSMRRRLAIIGASLITVAIFFMWLAVLPARLAEEGDGNGMAQELSAATQLAPFAVMGKEFEALLASFKEQFGPL